MNIKKSNINHYAETSCLIHCYKGSVYFSNFFKSHLALFTSKMDLELRRTPVKCYIWSIALYDAETGMLQAVDQKHLESFQMWCWRRIVISWTDQVRMKKCYLLLGVKEQRNNLHGICKRKANCIHHILRRNCLLWQVIEGKIKAGTEVRGRRCRKLLDDLKERSGYSYLKEEALDHTIWRSRFGIGFVPVVRQTAKWMNAFLVNTVCTYDFQVTIV
jgi:hypothetical protein